MGDLTLLAIMLMWLAVSVVVAVDSHNRGRCGLCWGVGVFLLGLLVLVPYIIVVALE